MSVDELRRAVEDARTIYEKYQHGDEDGIGNLTGLELARLSGILTIDLPNALDFVDEVLVERMARALYETTMSERRAMSSKPQQFQASWDGPDTPQRTPFKGEFLEAYREEARKVVRGPLSGEAVDE